MNIRLSALPPLLVASSLLLGGAGACAADGPALKVITEAGISHVSGGVGEDEVQAIKSMAGNFNLKLLMTSKEGNYLSGVNVAIADQRGNKLLETVAEGPYLLAKLPPGNYRVTAAAQGQTRQQQVAVGGSGQREVRFQW